MPLGAGAPAVTLCGLRTLPVGLLNWTFLTSDAKRGALKVSRGCVIGIAPKRLHGFSFSMSEEDNKVRSNLMLLSVDFIQLPIHSSLVSRLKPVQHCPKYQHNSSIIWQHISAYPVRNYRRDYYLILITKSYKNLGFIPRKNISHYFVYQFQGSLIYKGPHKRSRGLSEQHVTCCLLQTITP